MTDERMTIRLHFISARQDGGKLPAWKGPWHWKCLKGDRVLETVPVEASYAVLTGWGTGQNPGIRRYEKDIFAFDGCRAGHALFLRLHAAAGVP
jgi:hypothetical protein